MPNFTGAKSYRKKTLTRAIYIPYPFKVETQHKGLVEVTKPAFLAIDEKGFPYPIAEDTFMKTYEEAKGELFR